MKMKKEIKMKFSCAQVSRKKVSSGRYVGNISIFYSGLSTSYSQQLLGGALLFQQIFKKWHCILGFALI